jgi:hypothetical protein
MVLRVLKSAPLRALAREDSHREPREDSHQEPLARSLQQAQVLVPALEGPTPAPASVPELARREKQAQAPELALAQEEWALVQAVPA